MLLILLREFLGPLIGGALTEVFTFPTSAFLFGELLLALVMCRLRGVSHFATYREVVLLKMRSHSRKVDREVCHRYFPLFRVSYWRFHCP